VSEIAVVIPARDAMPYLGEALQSAFDQSLRPVDVVVVDDGSSDDTAATARAFGPPVRVVGQPPLGIAAAVNRGLREITAPLVAMLDADDLWVPGKLEAQAAALDGDPGIELVFGHAAEFVSPELEPAQRAAFSPRPVQPFRAKATMLARREVFDRVGPFDESLTVGDFVDWCARADAAGVRSLMLDRLVLQRRLHPRNHGLARAGARADFVRIARRSVQRRREGSG
jgi:glycosyltransferase involved in cell wall biosynthesis